MLDTPGSKGKALEPHQTSIAFYSFDNHIPKNPGLSRIETINDVSQESDMSPVYDRKREPIPNFTQTKIKGIVSTTSPSRQLPLPLYPENKIEKALLRTQQYKSRTRSPAFSQQSPVSAQKRRAILHQIVLEDYNF